MEEEQCAVIEENAWRTAVEVSGEKVEGALHRVATDLGDWSRNVLGDLEKRIKHVRRSLEECRSRISGDAVGKEEVLNLSCQGWRSKRTSIGDSVLKFIG